MALLVINVPVIAPLFNAYHARRHTDAESGRRTYSGNELSNARWSSAAARSRALKSAIVVGSLSNTSEEQILGTELGPLSSSGGGRLEIQTETTYEVKRETGAAITRTGSEEWEPGRTPPQYQTTVTCGVEKENT